MTSLHPVLVPCSIARWLGVITFCKAVSVRLCRTESWIVVLVNKNSFPPSGKQDGAQVRHTPVLARWPAHFIGNVLISNSMS